MIPLACPGCNAPAASHLVVRYLYPRDIPVPGAVDPSHVHGSAPLITCGSVPCQAAGMLAVVEDVVTDTAFCSGQLLDREDVHVITICGPGERMDLFWVADDGQEAP